MKRKIYFLPSSIILVCLFSFTIRSNNNPINLKLSFLDTPTKVTVQLQDIPGASVYCGILKIEQNYKFKLVGASRHIIKSKNGLIKIRFTCPKETMAGMIINKNYNYYIVPLTGFSDTNRTIASQIIDDGIPVYKFTYN